MSFKKRIDARRKRRQCLHHEPGGNPANTRRAWSWIEQQLIDTGRRKLLWCTHCGQTWVV